MSVEIYLLNYKQFKLMLNETKQRLVSLFK